MKCLDILYKPKTLFVYTIHIHTRGESYLNANQFSADKTDSSRFQDVSQNVGNTNTRGQHLTVNKLTQECIFDSCSTHDFFLNLFKVSHFGPCKQELLKKKKKRT